VVTRASSGGSPPRVNRHDQRQCEWQCQCQRPCQCQRRCQCERQCQLVNPAEVRLPSRDHAQNAGKTTGRATCSNSPRRHRFGHVKPLRTEREHRGVRVLQVQFSVIDLRDVGEQRGGVAANHSCCMAPHQHTRRARSQIQIKTPVRSVKRNRHKRSHPAARHPSARQA
jgi:hypothetical protein